MAAITLFAILFLFFFQLISDFVEAIYAFGLLGTSIPPEIVSVLFLLSPLILFFIRKRISQKFFWIIGGILLASRLIAPLLDTRGVMIVSGIGVGAFLLFFPSIIWRGNSKPINLGAGLALGLSLSIFFRSLYSGYDISVYGIYQGIGWILAAVAAGLMIKELAEPVDEQPKDDKAGGFGRLLGGSLGLVAVLILFYFAFTAPNVIARWTGTSYLTIVALMVAVIVGFSFLLLNNLRFWDVLSPWVLLLWNLLFVLALVLTIFPHQLSFPVDPGAYPFLEPPVAPLWNLSIIGMIILFPVLIVDFMLFYKALVDSKPNPLALGGSFATASLFLLLMIFGQVFTTVYSYIPVVGPFFRDRFWQVFLVLGVVVMLAILSLRKETLVIKPVSSQVSGTHYFLWILAGVGIVTILGVYWRAPNPVQPLGDQDELKILTYNIQQGYSEDGLKNFNGQLELIREVDADIIGLQESDTNRIAGGNADIVRYFADRLNMYSYYGPKVVPGTFGIALLSKYPIENPRTYYMYSELEQTAAIFAEIKVGDKVFNVFVTHLGNGGPLIQQEHFLAEIIGKGDVIAMGDFNFNPGTDQYELTTQMLDDAWLLRWPEDVDDEGVHLDKRIDHIFVSPGTQVLDSRYILSPASDHPAMVVEIEW